MFYSHIMYFWTVYSYLSLEYWHNVNEYKTLLYCVYTNAVSVTTVSMRFPMKFPMEKKSYYNIMQYNVLYTSTHIQS